MVYCSEFCRRNSNYEKKKAKRQSELRETRVCACRECDNQFTTIYKTKKYCSDKCTKLESRLNSGWTPKVKEPVVEPKKRVKAKKKYTPVSKPEKPKKVVMALSKDVINCLDEKPKKSDDLVHRDYTDNEVEMIAAFLNK